MPDFKSSNIVEEAGNCYACNLVNCIHNVENDITVIQCFTSVFQWIFYSLKDINYSITNGNN